MDNTLFFLQVLHFLFIIYMWQDLNFKEVIHTNLIDVTNTCCYEILTLLQVLEAYF